MNDGLFIVKLLYKTIFSYKKILLNLNSVLPCKHHLNSYFFMLNCYFNIAKVRKKRIPHFNYILEMNLPKLNSFVTALKLHQINRIFEATF